MTVEWDSVLKAVTTEENLSIFKEKLSKQIREHIPRKNTRKIIKSPWMTSETKYRIKVRNNAWDKFQLYDSV